MQLESPGQLRHGKVKQTEFILKHHAAVLFIGLPVLVGDFQWCAYARSMSFDGRQDIALLVGNDRGDMGLQYAGLFTGDGFDGVAEILLVIKVNSCDDRDSRFVDDVRRIKATAEADFQQETVCRLTGKCQQSGRRGDLEKGDRIVAIGVFAFLQQCAESVFADEGTGAG